MSSIVNLRDDYDAAELRILAKRARDPRQIRRLLALAAVYDGMSRAEAARVGGMERQTLRDWAHRFNAEGPEGPRDRPRTGRRRQLGDAQMEELAEIVETGPNPGTDGVVRWRRIDLKRVIEERFSVIYSERAASDPLARLSFSYLSGRPQHPRQDQRALDGFKKLPANARSPPRPFAQGQAHRDLVPGRGRLGRKNGRIRLWAKTGSRPRLPADQRYNNAYLFRAICPLRGTGATLMLPKANTPAMHMHLDEISRNVAATAHAVVLMDQPWKIISIGSRQWANR